MIYSFDIFDTCLVRKCGCPDNALDILSTRVFRNHVNEYKRREFVVRRKQADIACSNNPQATIIDIYGNGQFDSEELIPTKEIIQQELQLEKELLVPVLSIYSFIEGLRDKGNKILFISDTYLPKTFLEAILREKGLMKDPDILFVSCEIGKRKCDGGLFQFIHDTEHIPYRKWHHYGDNYLSDYCQPKKFGIKAHLVEIPYSPYQKMWNEMDHSLSYKTGHILAGLSRSLLVKEPKHTHKPFVYDLVAPFFASMVYRIMIDAKQNGITKLFFCARDSYTIYLIAKRYEPLFEGISVHFLFISQTSLYQGNKEARIYYFIQEGLYSKTDNVAIVDIRSSGHTLVFLNKESRDSGFKEIRGYFFEIFCNNGRMDYVPSSYYAEVTNGYSQLNTSSVNLTKCWHLYEMFFSIQNTKRTIDYKQMNGKYYPVFCDEEHDMIFFTESKHIDKESISSIHRHSIMSFIDDYIKTGLYKYSNEIFELYAMPTLMHFFNTPAKQYLPPLKDFYVYNATSNRFDPYIIKSSLLNIVCNKGRNCMWRRGMLAYNLPDWAFKILLQFSKEKTHNVSVKTLFPFLSNK